MNRAGRVIIRTDASLLIGSGHVMRCLALAEALCDAGASVGFISRSHPGNLNELIRKRGFSLIELPALETTDTLSNNSRGEYAKWLGVSQEEDASETIAALHGELSDWLIIDHYALDEQWEQKLRPHVRQIMVLDDLADRRHDCDVLLDQNYFEDGDGRYEKLVSPFYSKFLGPQFALLRSEFAAVRKSLNRRSGKIEKVFVFLGGVDQENITGKVIAALSAPELKHLEVDVVIGAQNPNRIELERQLEGRVGANLHIQIDNIAQLMAGADLAIGAGGSTTWERLCLGLPTLVIAMAENQRPFSEQLHQAGLITFLGESKNIGAEEIRMSLLALIHDEERVRTISRKGTALVDGVGAQKIAKFMLKGPDSETFTLRKATPEDCELYWYWTNDSDVRQSAFNSESIPWEQHQRWFQKMLQRPDVELFVLESPVGPVGQVRLERTDEGKIISYSLGRQFRGKGLGVKILEKVILQLEENDVLLIGEVKKNNPASIRTFQKLGFIEQELVDKGALRFVYHSTHRNGKP